MRLSQTSEKLQKPDGSKQMKTVTITESSRGNKLQKPLTLTLPEAETAADKKLQNTSLTPC